MEKFWNLVFLCFIAVSCQSEDRARPCPEERMAACLTAMARAHTAFQAGWTDARYSWAELKEAALHSCGCSSEAYEKTLRWLFIKDPQKLDELFVKASGLLNHPSSHTPGMMEAPKP
ncbi:MAG: hypothetical protein NZM15_03750 [Flavobacteriales bacterium]|nr:hypothetical protein [Flavobacteriales bacterium]MDW8431800.1 hypothetical protein [Flavobacteriales bacterium]